MAFVGVLSAPVLRSAFTGAAVSAAPARSAAVTMMSDPSPSLPFLPKPPALSADMPGYAGFDPLNISSTLPVKWFQEAEIKHGRICMLAALGFVFAELAPLPFYQGAPQIVAERHSWGVYSGSLVQVLLWCSFFEAITTPAVIQMIKGETDRAPGYFGLDPLGLAKDPAKMKRFQTSEIKNGRLAMLAVSGFLTQSVYYNQNVIDQLKTGNILPHF